MSDRYLRLCIGFIIALILTIFPMPKLISLFRPSWVLLLLLYVEYYLPFSLRQVSFVFLGLVLDVLLSTVFGEHVFAIILTMWLASTRSRRFQYFTMPQQLVLIGFFCFVYQIIIAFIDGLLGFSYNLLIPFTNALSGMLLWPWIRLLGYDFLTPPITKNRGF